jgi:multiple sugar transport system substrate-binding protein
MKRFIKIYILIFLLVFLFLSSNYSAEVINLRVSWWGSQTRHNATLKVIELFEKKYPNIKITPEYTAWSDYWTKLNTQAAAQNLPDVIQHDYQYITEWVTRGLLLPLDDLIAKKIINLSDVAPQYIQPGIIKGKTYGINLGVNALGLVYDPELFKKAGVPLPKTDWTWDDFKNTVIQLNKKLGIYGVEGFTGQIECFKIWLIENGQWLYSEDGKNLGFDEETFTKWWKMMLELEDANAVPSIAVDVSRTGLGVEDQFIVKQKSAMSLAWSNQLIAISRAANRPLKMALFPRISKTAKSGSYLKASMFFSINAQTKYPKEAGMFIDFFTNSIEANKILAAERGVPISKKIQAFLKPQLTPAQKEAFDFIKLVEKYGSPTPPPDVPRHAEVSNNVIGPIWEQIRYKQISLDKAFAQLKSQAEKILQRQ